MKYAGDLAYQLRQVGKAWVGAATCPGDDGKCRKPVTLTGEEPGFPFSGECSRGHIVTVFTQAK